MTKGKAAVAKAWGQPFEIEEFDVPVPEPGGIMVRITQAGICGSDLHLWRGDNVFPKPLPPEGRVGGHEGTGVVAQLGAGISTDFNGTPIAEGDRVMHAAINPCNQCYRCLRGEQNWCVRGRATPPPEQFRMFSGTYAEYYYVPPGRPIFKVPDELPDEALGYVNCAMGTVTEGLSRAGCAEGDYVVIQGAGGLGLNATAMAKDMGAHRVIVLDRIPHRLALAEEFGADFTVNIDEFNTQDTRRDRIWELTDGRGANICVELVGRAELLLEGLEYLGNGGTFIEIGDIIAGDTVPFDPSTLVWGAKRIMGSIMYRPSLLPVMMEMMVKNRDRLPYDKIVSHTYPLEQINEALDVAEWQGKETAVSRAMITP